MIRKIQRKWFEVWGDEEAQNCLLKYLLLLFTGLCVAQLVVIAVFAFKKPLIISINAEETRAIEYKEPDANTLVKELIRAVQKYLRYRHNWEWSNIEDRTKDAAQYIAPEFREKYLVSVQEQVRLAKERQVSQKLFADDPQVDMKTKKVIVRAERILIVNGIRAAQAMNLEIGFTLGSRSQGNPEGIFITSEKVEVPN